MCKNKRRWWVEVGTSFNKIFCTYRVSCSIGSFSLQSMNICLPSVLSGYSTVQPKTGAPPWIRPPLLSLKSLSPWTDTWITFFSHFDIIRCACTSHKTLACFTPFSASDPPYFYNSPLGRTLDMRNLPHTFCYTILLPHPQKPDSLMYRTPSSPSPVLIPLFSNFLKKSPLLSIQNGRFLTSLLSVRPWSESACLSQIILWSTAAWPPFAQVPFLRQHIWWHQRLPWSHFRLQYVSIM